MGSGGAAPHRPRAPLPSPHSQKPSWHGCALGAEGTPRARGIHSPCPAQNRLGRAPGQGAGPAAAHPAGNGLQPHPAGPDQPRARGTHRACRSHTEVFTQGFVTFHAWAGTCHRRCYKKPPGLWLSRSSSCSCPGRAPHPRPSRPGSSTSSVALGWYRHRHGLGGVIKPGEMNQELLPRLLQNLFNCTDAKIRKSGHLRLIRETRELRALPCTGAGKHPQQPHPARAEG